MPELPEVEIVRCGVAAAMTECLLLGVHVRQPQLRWPVPAHLDLWVRNQVVHAVSRRAKYLLLHTGAGDIIVHLGMSGSLRLVEADHALAKHDHVDFFFNNAQQQVKCLRFNDPRRFGAVLWRAKGAGQHPLLQNLGPEPLSSDFHSDYLYHQLQRRSIAVKIALMDSRIVSGIGNIYANEALFLAGISPLIAAQKLSRKRCQVLVDAVQITLQQALSVGGSTLKNFVNSDGKPGYFQQHRQVYQRALKPCLSCHTPIRQQLLAQRSTYWCPCCQTG